MPAKAKVRKHAISDHHSLQSVLAALAEGVIVVDKKKNIAQINARTSSMLGMKGRKLAGKKLGDVIPVTDLAQSVDVAIKEEATIERTIHVGDKTIDLAIFPVQDLPAKPIGAVLVLNDITELQTLDRIRSDFVANASHELKTPITAIRGLIETMIDDPDMDREHYRRFAARIRSQTVRMGALVTDLLTLSRFDSPSDVIDHEDLDVSKTVAKVYEILKPEAADRSIVFRLETRRARRPVLVKGDEEALIQLVTNLVDNALKYTAELGSVVLAVAAKDGFAVITVADSGIGIPDDQQKRIFERFYRVDKARSRDLGGTGLGLSIVKHIAMAHEGDVSVSSEVGVGSTFTVRIPMP